MKQWQMDYFDTKAVFGTLVLFARDSIEAQDMFNKHCLIYDLEFFSFGLTNNN